MWVRPNLARARIKSPTVMIFSVRVLAGWWYNKTNFNTSIIVFLHLYRDQIHKENPISGTQWILLYHMSNRSPLVNSLFVGEPITDNCILFDWIVPCLLRTYRGGFMHKSLSFVWNQNIYATFESPMKSLNMFSDFIGDSNVA